ncbi:D-ribose pyranase [Macrococcoides caseolyticum]|uniref:D-ribose pyranase n=1 Tax=Macrococcoides caseolyticum TaxID=69966 RepID=UPI001F368DB4|nr:D-ribose pyranase [Macrococcus caseolyticus]MCE4956001.1 D-ribose pyranase [Macrococcus caseolyticus]
MYKTGTLNSEISKVLSDLGHTDEIVIGDCGLPIPDGVKKIDLALVKGLPGFMDVLTEIKKHMVIEHITLAEEIKSENAKILSDIEALMGEIESTFVTHESFKSLNKGAKAIIRTGEATPYSNIILRSGVNF